MIKKYLEFIKESIGDKKAFLFEGPSSSGKTYLSKELGAKHYYDASSSDIVIIGSDDFVGLNNNGEENRLKLDPESIRKWAKGNDYGIVSKLYRKDGKDTPPNPKEDEYIEGTDPRVWYMSEVYKTGPWKKVIFDDIGDAITKYIPNVTPILLYTPIEFMVGNINNRNTEENESEHRNPNEVLNNQYANYYKAVYNSNESLDDKKWTIKELKITLKSLKGLNIDEFISKLGIKDDNFWIGLRNKQKGEIVNTRDPKSIKELKSKL